MARPAAIASGALACCLLLSPILNPAAPARAGHRTFEVFRGPGAIPAAIAKAHDGDTLRIHPGRYRGSFTVDKRLSLVAAGRKRPVIDGRCASREAIHVTHGGAVFRHLKVVGGGVPGDAFAGINFDHVPSGRARDLVVRDTCGAEYGINVFAGGEVDIRANRTSGFGDAGIYVGAISSTGDGALRVRGNETFRNSKGIIVEDSAGGRIRVRKNVSRDNALPDEPPMTGIFLHNSDGVLLEANVVTDNGERGIHLDAASDLNRLNNNTVVRNPTDFLIEGSGNCGNGNVPEALPPC